MGFFDDLAMGFGAKPKTQDFKQRTAATMESNRNPGGAQQYRESRGVTNADINTNFSPSTFQVVVFLVDLQAVRILLTVVDADEAGLGFLWADTSARLRV